MAFQQLVQPDCPECGKPAVRVLESKKSSDGQRRRKHCEACGYRFTTYEVSADFYNKAQQNRILVSKLHALLSGNALATQPVIIKCSDCLHNQGNDCAFGFPEYDTPDSFDCNHYDN